MQSTNLQFNSLSSMRETLNQIRSRLDSLPKRGLLPKKRHKPLLQFCRRRPLVAAAIAVAVVVVGIAVVLVVLRRR